MDNSPIYRAKQLALEAYWLVKESPAADYPSIKQAAEMAQKQLEPHVDRTSLNLLCALCPGFALSR
jgi:hypothetical protein